MPDTQQTVHELDILIVANPDVNCDFIDPEIGYSHKDYFEAKWSGQPHRIIPGRTKRMPRFLAQHYAKHLADHILMMREEKTGRRGLLQSPVERPRVLKEILVGVEEYHITQPTKAEGQKVTDMVGLLNPEEKQPEEPALDLGTMPNPLIGNLKPEPQSLDQIMKAAGEAGPTEPTQPTATTPPVVAPNPDQKNFDQEKYKETSIYDPEKPKPSRKQLLEDCYKLNIEITGKETVDQLISKLKAF